MLFLLLFLFSSLRGYVYCSQEVQPGWLVWANGRLLHRLLKEKDDKIFCLELDPMTLKVHNHNVTGLLEPLTANYIVY